MNNRAGLQGAACRWWAGCPPAGASSASGEGLRGDGRAVRDIWDGFGLASVSYPDSACPDYFTQARLVLALMVSR